MDLSIFGIFGQAIARWAAGESYALLFVAILIEGPAVTAAGSFAAALGAFSLWIVFVLSVLGNLIPDIVFYAIGFWGRQSILDRYGHYFGVTKERMMMAESLIKKHSGKSIIAIKMIPFIALPGLVMAGATRMNIKKYMFWSLSVTVPSSLLYLALGYYFGAAYHRAIDYVDWGILVIAACVITFFVIAYLEKKFSKRLLEGAEKG